MSYFHFSTYGLSLIAASTLSLSVGVVALLSEWKSSLNRSFFLISWFGAVWLFTFGMVQLVRESEDAYRWMAFDYGLAVPFISPSVYLFSSYWSGDAKGIRRARRGLAVGLVLAVIALGWSRHIFDFVPWSETRFNRFRPTLFGQTYFWTTMALFTCYTVMAFRNFRAALVSANSRGRRTQCLIFIVAAAVGYTGAIDFVAAAGVPVYPFGFLSFSGFQILIAYAIVRHRFLNIDILIKKTLLVLLIYGILLAGLLALLLPVSRQVSAISATHPLPVIAVLSIVFGTALSMGPIIYGRLVQKNLWIRSHLGAGFTHELKTPLSAIQGAIEVIASAPADEQKRAVYLDLIERNVTRLDGVVTGLLDVIRLQENGATIDRELIDLQTIVEEEIRGHEAAALGKSVTILFQRNGPMLVEADREKLGQVVSNLLSNAVRFSPAGESVGVALIRRGQEVICEVNDAGPGVPTELKERIFERFVSGAQSTRGAGLGLAIAKGWVELHGGRIWVDHDPSRKGASFKFAIPIGSAA